MFLNFKVFMLFILLPPLLAGGAFAQNYSNDQARKAYEIFADGEKEMKSALQAKDEKRLRSAERTLLRARDEISDDLSSLSYTITKPQLVPGGGRWPRFEDVRMTESPSYFPNQLIKEIRHTLSPLPEVVATIKSDGAGQRLTVKVTNNGKSDMEAFRVRVVGDGANGLEKVLSVVRAGDSGEAQFTFSLSPKQINGLRLEFNERYGFIPCPIRF